MSFTVNPATRQHVRPLIGLYSESGCGKTFGSLMLARGFVGPKGKIGLCDTESGRGSLYADVIPGGYDVLELMEPFTPMRYIEALRKLEEVSDIIVFDSMTHEWDSIGGVQDSALEISRMRAKKYNKEWDGVVQFGDWKHPKLEHAKMMARFLQSPKPIICCIRAKCRSRQVKGTEEMANAGTIEKRDIGRTLILRDTEPTPIQEDSFINEMTIHGYIQSDHTFWLKKQSHPDLGKCFPDKAPLEIRHGELLAKWCANPGGGKSSESPIIRKLKKTLWDATKRVHNENPDALIKWLLTHNIITQGQTLNDLTEQQLIEVNDKADIVLKEGK